MGTQEFKFKGAVVNGFLMLFVNLAVLVLSIVSIINGIVNLDASYGVHGGWLLAIGVLLLFANICMWCGFMQLEPNEARVTTWFGKYAGTFAKAGFYWINPFYGTKKLSLRARNLDAEPIKVNDKVGNPVMIGLVLVWKLKDTYKALFEVDTQTMASPTPGTTGSDVKSIMNALEKFVRVQSDAALRQVAGQYAYDDEDGGAGDLTLRSGSEDINQLLEQKLDDRLALAGIEVVEARINYLAYAPEIAAVMLRRQQASARQCSCVPPRPSGNSAKSQRSHSLRCEACGRRPRRRDRRCPCDGRRRGQSCGRGRPPDHRCSHGFSCGS